MATDADEELRKQAITDLQKYLPGSHIGRAFPLEADMELACMALNAAGRDGRAAKALRAYALYEKDKRSMLSSAQICRDNDGTSRDLPPPPSRHVTEKIDALGKLYQDAALRYARDIGDIQLIEDFQPLPMHADGHEGWLLWSRHYGRLSSATESRLDTSSRKATESKLNEQQKQEVVASFNRGRGESVAALARLHKVDRRTIDKVLVIAGVKV